MRDRIPPDLDDKADVTLAIFFYRAARLQLRLWLINKQASALPFLLCDPLSQTDFQVVKLFHILKLFLISFFDHILFFVGKIWSRPCNTAYLQKYHNQSQ